MPLSPASVLRLRPARAEWGVVGLLTAICLVLPTRNSTPDAWYYAACVRHGHELLLPHHLLYNVVGWLWLRLLPAGADALTALKALNALAFGGCLLVLRSVLRRVGGAGGSVAGWLLVVGSSFGLLRFATEAETYMLPLLLSLLASRSWWRAVGEGRGGPALLAAGAWATGAALLHQIHALWGLGLLAGTLAAAPTVGFRPWKAGLLYALPALAVPVAYAAALPTWGLPFTPTAFWRFVFHDLYAGHAGAAPSGHTLLLTVINLVRTFGQLHGTTLALLRRWPVLGAVGLAAGALLLRAAWLGWQAEARQPAVARAAVRPATRAYRLFGRTHAVVLALQLACAMWAEGNAEFMVMLPALLALLLVRRPWPGRALGLAGAALLLWNMAFGLLPAHLLRLTNTAPLLTRIWQQPAAWWLLLDPNLVLNQLHYRTGNPVGPPHVLPAPAQLARRPGWSAGRVRAWLAARRAAGQPVYTDALGGPRLLDRARLTQAPDAAQRALLAGRPLVRVDSLPTFFGPVYLTEIR